jgi:hypothetical protein
VGRRSPLCGSLLRWWPVSLKTFLRRAGEIADEREGRTINGSYPPASDSDWPFRLRLREPSKTTRAQPGAPVLRE